LSLSKIQPLFNHCLVEIVDDYAGIHRSNNDDGIQKGILRDAWLCSDHITASTGYKINDLEEHANMLTAMKDKVVFWQQYAEAGNSINHDGHKYLLIPYYRLIACEEPIEESTK
jgi:hypothetical protein